MVALRCKMRALWARTRGDAVQREGLALKVAVVV
jgi:hypothetical protein